MFTDKDYSEINKAYESLKQKITPYLSPEHLERVQLAFEFAVKAHGTQRRQSGEPYVTHPLAVAEILSAFQVDVDSLCAAILHDTVEDTGIELTEIEDKFGASIACLVDGLTKIGKVKFQSNQEKLAENFRKMILAMAKDLRVILVKLADRLHNMRTIGNLSVAKSQRIAKETIEIYAPLANRLGIYGIKSELEDLCLRYLKPDIYQEIKEKVVLKRSRRQEFIDEVIAILKEELVTYGFKEFDVSGRPKHFYSIYKKMTERDVEFEDINDLFAFRIVVNSIRDCYEVLGIVHAKWKPMPGRFKDYIAMPKANLYQSLHTTVIRGNGEHAEIQIRTREMNQICEFGIAAHWAYKAGSSGETFSEKDWNKFSWLRQIVQWQSELKDPNEFLEAVKVDLFEEEIFVFTPKGDVISLPKGATTLDFAFAVHTDIGLRTIGSKVNGTITPLKRVVESGDFIEILTSPNQHPKKDWLDFVTTSKARNKIRSSLRKDQREEAKKIGKELLEKSLQKRGLNLESLAKSQQLTKLIKIAKGTSIEDVFIDIGYGKVVAGELLERLLPVKMSMEEAARQSDPLEVESAASHIQRQTETDGVLVSDMDHVLVHFAKCCSPLPGESIVGFITRGKGVSIHRDDCGRIFDLDHKRKIKVSWSKQPVRKDHSCFLRVLTREKMGVLAEVTQVISLCGANIRRAEINIRADRVGVLDFELSVHDLTQLEVILNKISAIPAVTRVERRSVLPNKVATKKKSNAS